MRYNKSNLSKAIAILAIPAIAPLSAQAANSSDNSPSMGKRYSTLEEVVVTASRRAESLQDTSLIVQANSGEDLIKAGVTEVADLSRLSPGVEIGKAGTALQVYIRGVGNPGSTAVTNPAVSVNIDGVYSARSQATAGNFFDLERVELLKGPQGTLYGRNASGGAVNLIPVKPSLDGINGFISIQGGNYQSKLSEGAINIPLSDTIAIRGAFQVSDREGYLSDGTDDDKHESFRLQALFEPSDTFTANLWGNYTNVHGKGPGFSFEGAEDFQGIISRDANDILFAGAAANGFFVPETALPPGLSGPVVGTAPTPPFPAGTDLLSLVTPIEDDVYVDMEFWNIHGTFDWDLGFAQLTVIPAYQEAEIRYKAHAGLSFEVSDPLHGEAPETSEATSLEVRLANDEGRLDWVAGLYYYDEAQSFNNLVQQGLIQNLLVLADLDTKSYGVFGEAKYSVTDEFRLIGGARYTEEKIKKSNFSRYALAPALMPAYCTEDNATIEANGVFACPLALDQKEDVSFNDVTWKVGLEYDFSEDSMLFASISTGFKAGGLSPVQGGAFDPEKLTAYELGSKNMLLDGRLQLNGELFYWLYDDHQEFIVQPDINGIVGQEVLNAGEAYARGASLDLAYAVGDNGQLNFAVEYLDAGYDSFSFEQSALFTPPETACELTDTGTPGFGGSNILNVDCSDLELSRAAEWSGTLGYTHRFSLPAGGSIEAGADVRFSSSRWISVDFLPAARDSAYQIYNANLSYTTADESLTILAFVRNITDEVVHTYGIAHSQVQSVYGLSTSAPRTYGARLEYRF